MILNSGGNTHRLTCIRGKNFGTSYHPPSWIKETSDFLDDGLLKDLEEWTVKNPAYILTALKVARQGSADICLVLGRGHMPARKRTEYTELHQHCMNDGVVLISRPGDSGWELVLTAVVEIHNGVSENVFRGYVLGNGLAKKVMHLVETGQISVLMDLDETIIHPADLQRLYERRDRLIQLRNVRHAAKVRTMVYPESSTASEDDLDAIAEMDILVAQFNIDAYEEYRDKGYVTIGDDPKMPRWERFYLDSGIVSARLVLRIHHLGQDLIFVRTNPKLSSSVMFVQIRPGWDKLSAVLQQPGFEVTIVTAGLPEWAFTAWAVLLDPQCRIIPWQQRKNRVQHVDRTVSVSKVLTKVLLGLDATPGPFPMAVVFDDRCRVWDPWGQAMQVQVVAFDAPYQDGPLKAANPSPAFSNSLSSVDGSTELARACKVLQELHTRTFESIRKLKNSLSAAVTTGLQPEDNDLSDFEEPPYEVFTITQQLQMVDMQSTFKRMHLPLAKLLPRLHPSVPLVISSVPKPLSESWPEPLPPPNLQFMAKPEAETKDDPDSRPALTPGPAAVESAAAQSPSRVESRKRPSSSIDTPKRFKWPILTPKGNEP